MPRKYPKETAGSIMTNEFPRVRRSATIGDVLNLLFKIFEKKDKVKEIETINYIYIVDKKDRLVGVLSIKEIFGTPRKTKIEEIMKRDLVKIRPLVDQEKVVYLALKYSLKAIPVVDDQNHLLGIVPSDMLLEILNQEAAEDLLRISGTHPKKEIMDAPPVKIARARLPWLFFGILGGVVAGSIIGIFRPTLESLIALALYIPVMMHGGGNIGNQSAIIFIRSLMTGNKRDLLKYFLKEIKIGLILGLSCALLLSLVGLIWQGSLIFGLTLGFSMFFTMVLACVIGIFIPWLLNKLKIDPALGAGPFITAIEGVLSLLIYFGFVSIMLKYLVV